jgi:serine O-acetyltransferase
MKPAFQRLRLAVSAPRLVAHVMIMRCSSKRDIIEEDLRFWAKAYELSTPRTGNDLIYLFLTFMTRLPEFRNVFYLRIGNLSWLLRWMCPPLGSLKIDSRSIGPGLYIQHGDNTFVSAESIGANCWIGRHVVIGFSNLTDRPSIGNNVRIYAGAKIIGNVSVGDNATIGLNTVVMNDVAPNVTLLGVPGRVIWKERCNSTLKGNDNALPDAP